jgi:tetratricopeptide (TPR) repeat protein
MLGRWASLRVRELSLVAHSLEQEYPARAQQLWRRVLCIDPAKAEERAGVERTPAVVVHRPTIVTSGSGESSGDAWAELSQSLYVRLPRPAPAPRPEKTPVAPGPPDTAAFDQALEELETRVRAAQFEAALETAEKGRRAALQLGPEQAKRTARLEVLAATAALALGRTDAAQTSFERALDADPQLTLDPASTPPKVRRALERVRKERGP